MVLCPFSAAFILSDGSREANTHIPQAEIPKISTSEYLKGILLFYLWDAKCILFCFIFYVGILWQECKSITSQ